MKTWEPDWSTSKFVEEVRTVAEVGDHRHRPVGHPYSAVMKIDIMRGHPRVQDDGDQSGTGQDRDDADIDAAPGEPFHSAALQQEIGMSQEGWSSSERPRF